MYTIETATKAVEIVRDGQKTLVMLTTIEYSKLLDAIKEQEDIVKKDGSLNHANILLSPTDIPMCRYLGVYVCVLL